MPSSTRRHPATPARAAGPGSRGHGRGQGTAGLAGGRVRRDFHLRGQLGELIQGRVDPDQRELALDDGQLGPHTSARMRRR